MKIKTIEEARRIFTSLENGSTKFYETCKKIAYYLMPLGGYFPENGDDYDLPDFATVVNNAIESFLDDTAAGMMNGMTSPSLKWFEMETEDYDKLDRSSKAYIKRFESLIERILQDSTFYQDAMNVYKDELVFGIGCLFAEEDFNSVVKFHFLPVGSYFLGKDMFARRIKKTVGQIVDEFGLDALPHQIKLDYELHRTENIYTLYHLIFKNPEYIRGSKFAQHFPYKSVYWFDNDVKFISEGGYDYWPVFAPRWMTKKEENFYGYGPGWKIMGDVVQLQKMEYDKLGTIEKTYRPPLLVSADVQGPIDISAGSVSRTNGQTDNRITPLFAVNPAGIGAIEASIDKLLARNQKNTFADVFSFLTPENMGKMTAYEIASRTSERMQKAGSVLRQNESELSRPVIETIAYLVQKHNLLGPAPENLQGRELKIKFVSVVANAQRSSGLNNYTAALERVIALAQANPQILDKIDFDAYADIVGEKLGANLIIKNTDEANEVRTARAEAAASQQRAAAMVQTIESAKTASQAKLGDNNALDALLKANGINTGAATNA